MPINKATLRKHLATLSVVTGLIPLAVPPAPAAEKASRLPVEELRLLADVLNAIKSGYVDPVDDHTLIANMLRGLLSGLDGDSAYLDADDFKDLQVGDLDSASVGVVFDRGDEVLTIRAPIEGSPAERAGLRSGDQIIKIDGVPTNGRPASQWARQLRGPADSPVALTIRRMSVVVPVVVTLRREVVKQVEVRSDLLAPGYGYARITQLNFKVLQALAEHLRDLYRHGDLKGLVLDLRDNPGGLFNTAVGVAAAFLPANELVASMESRVDGSKTLTAAPETYAKGDQDFLAGLPAGLKTVPLVVLVNRGTAAGSEIIAGALQDHKRATVMGEPTSGRSSIQTVLPLPRGAAIKLTTARWKTPNGQSLAGKGLMPDVFSRAPDESVRLGSKADPMLREALHYLQEGTSPAQ